MRAELPRPGLSGRVAAARCARWAVRLEQTLGSPASHHPWASASPRWGSQVELPVHSGAPSAVGLTGPASALPCCRALAAAATAGSVPQRLAAAGRGQPGLERPLSGRARLQITTWLAAGAPSPSRHWPLQLEAKFMPAALQWWPRSARSIPTTRLHAVRPEGGVSGV